MNRTQTRGDGTLFEMGGLRSIFEMWATEVELFEIGSCTHYICGVSYSGWNPFLGGGSESCLRCGLLQPPASRK